MAINEGDRHDAVGGRVPAGLLPAGLLLTGGASRRMGIDKATLVVRGDALAVRLAGLLSALTSIALEVGPGSSGLPALVEDAPGSGPLAAIAAGRTALVGAGVDADALVLACDLPRLGAPLLALLATHASSGSVLPVADGVPQPLCARWSAADLDEAVARLERGERSLRWLAQRPGVTLLAEPVWSKVAALDELADADRPEDLDRLVPGWRVVTGGDAGARGGPRGARTTIEAVIPPASGTDWVQVSDAVLSPGAATDWAITPDCGAVVTFCGTVRDHAEGRPGVVSLEYEAYPEHATRLLAEVAAQARERWPVLGRIALLHRVGLLGLEEVSVVVVTTSPSRPEAFAAARFCIDTLKATVPIWKRETWDGGADWSTCGHALPGTPDRSPARKEEPASGAR